MLCVVLVVLPCVGCLVVVYSLCYCRVSVRFVLCVALVPLVCLMCSFCVMSLLFVVLIILLCYFVVVSFMPPLFVCVS